MNVEFDYEIKKERLSGFEPYFIVVESADGTTRENNLVGRFQKRGTLRAGIRRVPKGVEGPVKVRIEKEEFRRGNRSRVSNVLRIETDGD